jgi:FixJ family two-component response regulator
MDQPDTVFVIAALVDQQAINGVASNLGLCSYCFTTPEQFLVRFDPSWRGCVALDVQLTDGGLQVVEQIRAATGSLPLIVISSDVDVPMAVEIMRRGAASVLVKPYSSDSLAACLSEIIQRERQIHQQSSWKRDIKLRLDTLHPRERTVLALMITDVPNKTIARRLGLGRRTVDRIRASVLDKMGADSAVEAALMLGEARPMLESEADLAEPPPTGE